jgi:hypothetical protein
VRLPFTCVSKLMNDNCISRPTVIDFPAPASVIRAFSDD